MTNKAFSRRMLDSKKRTGSGTQSYKWKYHPTPWKVFINAVTKPQKTILPRFGSKRFVLGIVALAVIIGGVVLVQGPLFHSYQTNAITTSGPDPITPLWKENFINDDLSSWRTSFFASFTTTGGGTCTNPGTSTISCKGILLSPNSTNSAYALTRNPVTISSVANKVLTLNVWYFFSTSTTITAGNKWYFYLTTNGTLPSSERTYDPFTDKAVALILRETAISATKANTELLFQRNNQLSISDSEQPNCPLTSSCFILVGNTNLLTTVANQKNLSVNLNETGAQGPSFVQDADISSGYVASTTVTNQPWLDINQQYYLGVWDVFGSVPLVWNSNINSSNDCSGIPANIIYCLSLVSYQPVIFPASAPPPAQIDTGGFFGPIIRAFIAIGVFIAQNIINFLAFLANVLFPVLATVFGVLANALVGALNAIGNFFGLGNIGTTIQSFFTAIGTFLVNGVGAVLTQIGNAVSFFVNGTTAFVNIAGTYWAKITSFFTALGNLLSIIGTVLNDFLIVGGFSGNLALFMDWTWGMYKTYDEGTEGFHRWLDFNENVFLRVGKIAYFLSDHLFTIILRVKQLIVQWV